MLVLALRWKRSRRETRRTRLVQKATVVVEGRELCNVNGFGVGKARP